MRSITRRNISADRVVFGHEWDVAVEVESVIVEQSTHESCLSLITVQLGLVGLRERRKLRVGAVAKELVAQRYVVVDAIVHIAHPCIVGIPLHKGYVGHVITGKPCVRHFVCRALLEVNEHTHVVLAMA